MTLGFGRQLIIELMQATYGGEERDTQCQLVHSNVKLGFPEKVVWDKNVELGHGYKEISEMVATLMPLPPGLPSLTVERDSSTFFLRVEAQGT